MTTAPPRLYAVPQDAPVSLLKGAADVAVLEPEVVEAIPVDQPRPPAEGWRADRTARLAAAPAIVPAWLRSRAQLADSAVFAARWYGHVWGYHGLRAPVYTTRLWLRAPRGVGVLAGEWWRWVTDAEIRPIVSAAARGNDQAALPMSEKVADRVYSRWRRSGLVAVSVALPVYMAAFLLPHWVMVVAAAGVLSVLGVAGRVPDRPIVHRYVSVQMQRRLESPEVEEALEAIGVKGTVDWANPIAIDGPGWLAELDLPRGVLADTILEKRPELAAAMRRPLGCVWPEADTDAHPGRLRLWVAREDPSKAKRRLWPLLKGGQADLFKPLPFGWDPRGRLVTLDLIGANVLIGGVMGSGKTSAVLVLSLWGALDPTCELWLYEMKGSGDLEPVRPVCHRYLSGDDDEDCRAALDALRALEQELNRRKKVVKGLPMSDVPEGRKVSRRLADRRELRLHPLLAIFDEAHTLFEHEDYGEEAAAIAGRLIRKARAYAMVVAFTTQRPDAKSIPKAISDNAILRFCLAVTGHIPNNLVLGSGMYARGIRATMFDPRKDAGTGWLARSALDAHIARAAFIKQDEAVQIGKRALALRIAAGTLTGEAAGEELPETDGTDLLDHLRAVWPAGEETMHSAALVEALAVYRPDLYGAWMEQDVAARSTTLAAALKPHGVRTRQINKRGQGGSAKGLRWDDVADARRPEES